MFNRRTSLSTDFLLFSFLLLIAVIALSTGFWVQVYHERLKEKEKRLPHEALRIESVLTDSMAYITQYTGFIGEKIRQQNHSQDLNYIAALISDTSSIRPQEYNFYFTTTFDWVTPDKYLRASSKAGVLEEPFDMRDRDYLSRTPLYPWTLQLSPPRIGGLSKEWIIPAGMGITDDKGNFLGSLTLGFALKGLEQRIARTLGQSDVHYLVLTQDLKLILDSKTNNAMGPDPDFNLAIDRQGGWLEKQSDFFTRPVSHYGVDYRYFQKLHHYPYIVLVGYDQRMPAALFNDIVLSRGLMVLGVGCIILVVLWLMGQRLIKPVTELVRSADRIRRGEQVEIRESPIHEIDLLGRELKKISEYVQNEHRINLELSARTRQLQTATKEALAARDAAVKADQAKTEFLANISHELRTPMNAIVGLTEIMRLKRVSFERQEEYLETMEVSARQLLQLINDLLDIAKIESNQFELEHIPFDLLKLVEEVVQINAVRAKEKNIVLHAEFKNMSQERLIGDPTRIKQVLINLVTNAIKFTEKGGVTLDVRCRSLPGSQKEVAIAVIDTGIGIRREKLDSVFNKFSQADTSITRKYGGTGLGLSISKNLIHLMNGTLRVESEYGRGSRFTLCVVLPVETQRELEISRTPSAAAEGVTRSLDLLLVEDNKQNILVTASLLEVFGHSHTVARNGQEALDILKSRPFDGVLMDIQMPGMDGFKATRYIREQEKANGGDRIPIIGMTACAMKGDRERCLAAGMDDYIAKPFDPQALIDILKRLSKKLHRKRHVA